MIHVVCGFGGGVGQRGEILSIIKDARFSQTWTSGSTNVTTDKAPKASPQNGQPVYRVRSSVEVFVAVGKTSSEANTRVASASVGPRYLVPANEDYDISVTEGDYLAWKNVS